MRRNQWLTGIVCALVCAALLIAPAAAPAQAAAACPQTGASGITQIAPGIYKVCLTSGFCFEMKLPYQQTITTSCQTVTPKPTSCPAYATCPTAATSKPSASPTKTPAATASPAPTSTPSGSDNYTQAGCSAQAQQMLNLVNSERAKNGRSALVLDSALCAIALKKSEDMVKNNYFAHTSPTYGSAADMLRTFGYSFTSCGENIARHASVEKAHAAFMSSAGHKQNILSSSWTKVGIGIVQNNGYVTITQIFVR